MIRKKDLIKNLGKYTPDEIAQAIKDGVISIYELGHETGGAFTPLLRRRVKAILDNNVPTVPVNEVAENIDSERIQTSKEVVESNNSERIQASKEVVKSYNSEKIHTSKEVVKDNNSERVKTSQIEEVDQDTQIIEKSVVEVKTEEVEKPIVSPPPFIPPLSTNIETESEKETPPHEKKMFRAPFSFTGRIRRLEYGLSCIISQIITFVLFMVYIVILANNYDSDVTCVVSTLVMIVLCIPITWFQWAQGCKRCHDIGNSGWFQLIPFYIFWMIFASGENRINQYGPNPKN